MTHAYFFQYNVPADNARSGFTNMFVNVFSEWNAEQFYQDGRPMIISILPVIRHLFDLTIVKDWQKAVNDIEDIVEKHFAEIAEKIKIENAQKVLSGLTIAPTLERFNPNEIYGEKPFDFDETYTNQLKDLS